MTSRRSNLQHHAIVALSAVTLLRDDDIEAWIELASALERSKNEVTRMVLPGFEWIYRS